MNRRLRKNRRLARLKMLRGQPRPVLLVHVRRGVAVDGHDVIRRPRVVVHGQHGARAQVEHRHCSKHTHGQKSISTADKSLENGACPVCDLHLLVMPLPLAAGKVAEFMLTTPPGEKL